MDQTCLSSPFGCLVNHKHVVLLKPFVIHFCMMVGSTILLKEAASIREYHVHEQVNNSAKASMWMEGH